MSQILPCHICGQSDFAVGKLRESYGGGATWFEPNDRSLGEKLTFHNKSDVEARVCLGCKNLQLFAPDIGRDEEEGP